MPATFTSWLWWIFSVIGIGLALNIASMYIKQPFDRLLEKYSDSRKIKNDLRKKKFDNIINSLFSDQSELFFYEFKCLLYLLFMIMDMISTLACILLVIVIIIPTSSTPVLSALGIPKITIPHPEIMPAILYSLQ
jgi:hypothetical protein